MMPNSATRREKPDRSVYITAQSSPNSSQILRSSSSTFAPGWQRSSISFHSRASLVLRESSIWPSQQVHSTPAAGWPNTALSGPARSGAKTLVSRPPARGPPRPGPRQALSGGHAAAEDERQQGQDQEHEEQNLRNPGCAGRDATEAED